MKLAWNRRKSALLLVGSALVLLAAVTAAGFFLSEQAVQTDFSRKNLAPSLSFLFGTDWMGRDMLCLLYTSREDGYSVLLDGTNASDDAGDRPGMRALRELEVRSPLRECGLTKEEVRIRSRQAGLFTWDKPAYACLATRVPTGTRISQELLERTERAENALFRIGLRDFRARIAGKGARIQVTEDQFPLVLQRDVYKRQSLHRTERSQTAYGYLFYGNHHSEPKSGIKLPLPGCLF